MLKNESIIPGDYTGLDVKEVPYAEMEDFSGKRQTYLMDILTPSSDSASDGIFQDPQSARRPAVIFLHGGGHIHRCDKRQGYVPMFARILTKAGCIVFSPDLSDF